MLTAGSVCLAPVLSVTLSPVASPLPCPQTPLGVLVMWRPTHRCVPCSRGKQCPLLQLLEHCVWGGLGPRVGCPLHRVHWFTPFDGLFCPLLEPSDVSPSRGVGPCHLGLPEHQASCWVSDCLRRKCSRFHESPCPSFGSHPPGAGALRIPSHLPSSSCWCRLAVP